MRIKEKLSYSYSSRSQQKETGFNSTGLFEYTMSISELSIIA